MAEVVNLGFFPFLIYSKQGWLPFLGPDNHPFILPPSWLPSHFRSMVCSCGASGYWEFYGCFSLLTLFSPWKVLIFAKKSIRFVLVPSFLPTQHEICDLECNKLPVLTSTWPHLYGAHYLKYSFQETFCWRLIETVLSKSCFTDERQGYFWSQFSFLKHYPTNVLIFQHSGINFCKLLTPAKWYMFYTNKMTNVSFPCHFHNFSHTEGAKSRKSPRGNFVMPDLPQGFKLSIYIIFLQ